ncbi:MAG: electron transport complex subunit RsxA, partial [Pseudomonadales bacterium]
GASKKLDAAIGMSAATTFVLTLASGLSYLVNKFILVPLDIQYLTIVSFIVMIAGLVQFSEFIMRKTQPLMHQVLGIFIPLITTNCAVLGVALLNVRANHGFVDSLFYGFGAALGFSLVLIVFTAMRERLEFADIPAPFQGTAIHMITAGLLSLAFMGFTGMGS